MRVREVFPFLGLVLLAPAAAQACWQEAASRYHLPAELLVAIARVESNLNPHAVNRSHLSRTGTYDIGLMQINSAHLRQLARWGIGETELMNPCTNIHVGAWILAQSFTRHGAGWEAVGAYNAACTQLRGPACRQARERYIRKVAQHMPRPLSAPLVGGHP